MPTVSAAEHRLMEAAAHTPGGVAGVPQAVGKEFVAADDAAPSEARRRAAGIMFLTNDGETLLLRRGDGGDHPRTFGLPGGGVEAGESLEDAARRETLEETGIAYDGPLELLTDNGHFATFIARGVERYDVKICDESTGFAWARMDEAPQPLHPGLSDAFRIARACTELDLCELMRDGLLPSPQQLGNSWYFALRITGSGMAYRSKLEEHVFRDPAIFANDRFAQRCNGLFVVWQHPEKNLLDSESFTQTNVGAIVLPWVKYDIGETWGIARVMDAVAAEEMRTKQLSTSPGVAHTESSEGATVTLDGEEILLEGNPVLLDHLAVCELGVWDKGGPPQGVQVDQPNEEDMQISTAKADNQTAANPAASAPAAPAFDMNAFAAAMGTVMTTALQPLVSRMDSMEKNMPAAPLKAASDSTEEEEKKARADAEALEAKAKADAEAEEKAKADAEEKAKMDSIAKAEGEGAYADAQSRCDAVAQLYNQQAPRQLVGETLLAYRQRLVKPFQAHSRDWKDAPISSITDSAMFAIAEKAIYADAAAAARTVPGAGNTLREIRRRGPHGREIIEFAGPIGEWSAPFRMAPRSLARINKEA